VEEGIEDVEMSEEELKLDGYDFTTPADEEEEIPIEEDEDFERSELLLATSKVSADIDNTDKQMGMMLQGRALIKKQQETENKVKAETVQPKVDLGPSPGLGLIINGKIIDDGLNNKKLSVPKAVKPAKKKGADVYRKKK